MITIPTLTQLYNSILSDLESENSINIPIFGKNFLRAFAAVQAAKLKLYYLAIGNLQKNIFVDTAERESLGGTLERFGRVKLGRNPDPALAGEYILTITGTVGAVIPAGTTFKSNDDSRSPGKLFVLDTEYTLVLTTDTITVRALEAGVDSKLDEENELTATAPIANVNKLAVVEEESIAPLAAEDIEEYRTEIINSFRLEPQGGAATDYRLWAADAQGVAKVYPYAKSGSPNEIDLFVEANPDDSEDGKGTPSQSILDAVEEVVELDPDTDLPLNERGRRPLGVFQVHYLPITIREVDIVISGFTPSPSAAIQTAILNALTEAIDEIRPFISGADILEDKNDILDINKIIAVILTARPGSIFTSVDLQIDTESLSTFTFENGDIPYLNSVTYS